MQQNPSWKTNSPSASQEIPGILWNPKIHDRVHKSLALLSILSHINPIHYLSLFNVHFSIILPSTSGFSKWPLSLNFPHQSSICISPLPTRATCPAHLTLLDYIPLTISVEMYK